MYLVNRTTSSSSSSLYLITLVLYSGMVTIIVAQQQQQRYVRVTSNGNNGENDLFILIDEISVYTCRGGMLLRFCDWV